MGLFEKLKRFFRKKTNESDANGNEQDVFLSREKLDIHDNNQRERYVKACLEQIAESSKELEILNEEYNMVTSYLTDMELIDALDPEIRDNVSQLGKKIVEIADNQEKKKTRKRIMKEEEFRQMERIEEYMPEGLNKLKETEDYQNLIKKDLGRLSSERQAYDYRKRELISGQRNLKTIVGVCVGSMVFLVVILSVLMTVFKMDVRIGYLAAVLISAAALTILYFKHTESAKEIVRIEKTVNKLVLLENTVKIRYVNNTNLLEYLYVKYSVDSAGRLKKLWEQYQEEKQQRMEESQLIQDMEYSQASLVKVLRRAKLQDPNIWLHQAIALYDNREMVEIRHSLILRRQKLRSQMQYNTDMAQNAQDEISGVVESYPQYAQTILDLVSDYEKALA